MALTKTWDEHEQEIEAITAKRRAAMEGQAGEGQAPSVAETPAERPRTMVYEGNGPQPEAPAAPAAPSYPSDTIGGEA